jgi:hypothetical protein
MSDRYYITWQLNSVSPQAQVWHIIDEAAPVFGDRHFALCGVDCLSPFEEGTPDPVCPLCSAKQ